MTTLEFSIDIATPKPVVLETRLAPESESATDLAFSLSFSLSLAMIISVSGKPSR